MERYAGLAETGSDVGNALLLDARAIIAETLRTEFNPAVSQYLDALEQALPRQLAIALILTPPDGSRPQDSDFAKAITVLLDAVIPILSRYPIGRVIAEVLPVLVQLFSSSRERQMREVEAARAREHVRSQVRAAIERATSELILSLGPQLDELVEKAERAVTERVQSECSERERVLAQLKARIDAGEAAAAEARARAAEDRQVIEQHLTALRERFRPHSPD